MSRQRQYYKYKYFIVFYDKTGEHFRYSFDNVRDILKFQGKDVTRDNCKNIDRLLLRAFNSDNNTRLLDGSLMKVYLIDIKEEDKDNGDKQSENVRS